MNFRFAVCAVILLGLVYLYVPAWKGAGKPRPYGVVLHEYTPSPDTEGTAEALP